jgi:HK97 family phage portal protein
VGKKKSKGPVETAVAPPVDTRASYSIADPGLVEIFTGMPLTGVSVTEPSALGLTSVWRAVSAIAETIAGSLPLKAYRDQGAVRSEVTGTFLDEPGGPTGLTKPEWVSLVVAHMVLQGDAFLAHVRGGAGQMLALVPVHPSCVAIETSDTGKTFVVSVEGKPPVRLSEADMTHIPGLSMNGVRGLHPLSTMRAAIGSGIAADRTASNLFQNGLSVAGFVVVEGVTAEQAAETVSGLQAKASGPDNAGKLRALNRDLKFVPVMHTPENAQFLEQRQFSVEEMARLFGVPKVLLAQDGASSWGSGIAELNRWFAQTTLRGFTSRIQARLSRLLARGTFAEFDYAGLLSASPEREIELLISQVAAGLLTVDEARAIRNLPPVLASDPDRAFLQGLVQNAPSLAPVILPMLGFALGQPADGSDPEGEPDDQELG